MKVGLFIGYTGPEEGGGYTFIVELLAALQRLVGQCDHEFVLCHYDCDGVASQLPGLPAIDLKRRKLDVTSRRERLFERYPDVLEKVYRRVFRRKPMPRWDDRIYREAGIQFLFRISPWGFMSNDIPYGALVWDLAHRNWPWFPEVGTLPSWLGRETGYSLLLHRAAIVYTSTRRGQHELEFSYQVSRERIRILPHAVPSFAVLASDRPARPEVLQRLGVSKDYLFYPAQFWAHKNHVVVLEACKLVRERTGWDLGVVFTGAEKENESHVRAYAQRLGLAACCKFLRFVEQDDLVELYKGAYCLVYATFFGPDNLPPLEAFALGCPVVASAVPGSEEQLGDAALLFEPYDEETLANHIMTLREPATRAWLIARGRQRALEGPTWDDYARGVIRSFDEFARIRRAWP